MCIKRMRYLFILILFASALHASEIEEAEITPQEVIVWNHVNLETLAQLTADLKVWCHHKYKNHCEGTDVSTFLSKDRFTVFYQFGVDGVDDVVAVYFEKNGVFGKSWVSEWQYPFTVRPFVKGE